MHTEHEMVDPPAVRPYIPLTARRGQVTQSSAALQLEDIFRLSAETISSRTEYNKEIGMLVQEESSYCNKNVESTAFSDSDSEREDIIVNAAIVGELE